MAMTLNALEEKIIHLESTLCFQEDTIETMSEMMGKQQQEIQTLQNQLKLLSDYIKTMRSEASSGIKHPSEETPPPHY